MTLGSVGRRIKQCTCWACLLMGTLLYNTVAWLITNSCKATTIEYAECYGLGDDMNWFEHRHLVTNQFIDGRQVWLLRCHRTDW